VTGGILLAGGNSLEIRAGDKGVLRDGMELVPRRAEHSSPKRVKKIRGAIRWLGIRVSGRLSHRCRNDGHEQIKTANQRTLNSVLLHRNG